jgi:hypothetical protein
LRLFENNISIIMRILQYDGPSPEPDFIRAPSPFERAIHFCKHALFFILLFMFIFGISFYSGVVRHRNSKGGDFSESAFSVSESNDSTRIVSFAGNEDDLYDKKRRLSETIISLSEKVRNMEVIDRLMLPVTRRLVRHMESEKRTKYLQTRLAKIPRISKKLRIVAQHSASRNQKMKITTGVGIVRQALRKIFGSKNSNPLNPEKSDRTLCVSKKKIVLIIQVIEPIAVSSFKVELANVS